MKQGVGLSKPGVCALLITAMIVVVSLPSVAGAFKLPKAEKAPSAPSAPKAKKATKMRPIRDVAREQKEYREKKAREAFLAKFERYETPYHEIRSDQSETVSLEAAARARAMVRTYLICTSADCNKLKEPMFFLICKNQEDYCASGGEKDTTCIRVKDNYLLAHIPESSDEYDWSPVQYEGFRQFSREAISRSLPLWVERGLAVYFSDSTWAGDKYVAGFIPEERLAEVKKNIAGNKMLPFVKIMSMNSAAWRNNAGSNEIQAWSMVYFLLHADNGKYGKQFEKFMKALANKKLPMASFRENFGKDINVLQKAYEQWWSSLSENPAADRKTAVTVHTLTNFLALAGHKKNKFSDMTDFVTRIRAAGQISMTDEPSLWLPNALLDAALNDMGDISRWSLDNSGEQPALVLNQPDGTTFTGTYRFVKGLPEVDVKITRPGADGEAANK